MVEGGEVVVEVEVESVLLCFQDVVDVLDEGIFFLVVGSVAVDVRVAVFVLPGGFVELYLASELLILPLEFKNSFVLILKLTIDIAGLKINIISQFLNLINLIFSFQFYNLLLIILLHLNIHLPRYLFHRIFLIQLFIFLGQPVQFFRSLCIDFGQFIIFLLEHL